MDNRPFPTGDAIRFGWETLQRNFPFLIGVFLAAGVITCFFETYSEIGGHEDSFFGVTLSILSLLAYVVVKIGLITIALKFVDRKSTEFNDLFVNIEVFPQFTGAYVLYLLMVIFGLVFFIVPGIYVGLRFQFFGYFILEEKAGPIEALQKSAALTKGRLRELFALNILLLVLNFFGLMLLGVGLLLTLPIGTLALAYVYRFLLERETPADTAAPAP